MAFLSRRRARPCLSLRRMCGLESSRLFGLWHSLTNLIHWNKSDGHPLFRDEQNRRPGHPRNPSTTFLSHPLTLSDAPTADRETGGQQRHRGPLHRCTLPLMGGRTAIEQLRGGALPMCALIDRVPAVVLLRRCTYNDEHRVLERASAIGF
jgi:hypothetical protein